MAATVRRADERAQLPRRDAPERVDLEEPLLPVQVAQRIGDVGPRRPGDHWNPFGIARHRNGCGQLGRRDLPLQLRLGPVEDDAQPEQQQQNDREQRDQKPFQPSPAPAQSRPCRHLHTPPITSARA
jgi:hypothetical protein